MLYTLNLYSAVCQLHPNKTREKIEKVKKSLKFHSHMPPVAVIVGSTA